MPADLDHPEMGHRFYGPGAAGGRDSMSGEGNIGHSRLRADFLSLLRLATGARTPPLDSPPIPRVDRFLPERETELFCARSFLSRSSSWELTDRRDGFTMPS